VAEGFASVRVLVVDDHENMRLILSVILRAYGVQEIRTCENGAQALAAAADFRPDIIVTDFSMPELDGVAFSAAIRAHPDRGLHTVPIVMVSGHAHARQVIEARDAGVNEFLAKPVTGHNLADRIRRIIEENRLFIRARDYIGPDRRRGDNPKYQGPERRNRPA
jgi:PleD family two-component response regulator